jgi:cytochrome c5
MRQMKGKFVTARRLMAFILFTVFASGLAYGQIHAISFSVPYAFAVGSKALPAGTYTFSTSRDLSSLKVESATAGSAVENVITRISGPNDLYQGGYLIFDKAAKGLILSEVWISGADGILVHSIPKGHERVGVSGTTLDMNRSYSGKTAYNLTCARCHGDNGIGNPEADKFFGKTIPRLSSAEVQAMTDAQLKKQITQGDNLMPPVEIDESGFRHRLPPQDVEAVIAYLRTLKK